MGSSTSRSVTDANMVANGNPSFPLSEETLKNNNNNKRPSQQYANPNPNESSAKKRKFHSSHSPHSQVSIASLTQFLSLSILSLFISYHYISLTDERVAQLVRSCSSLSRKCRVRVRDSLNTRKSFALCSFYQKDK